VTYKVEINASTFAIPLAKELNTFSGSMIDENLSIVSRPDCTLSVAEAGFRTIPENPFIPAAVFWASAILSFRSGASV